MAEIKGTSQNFIARFYYRVKNAIKIGFWAFKNPDSLQESHFKMVSGVLEMIFKVAQERKHVMSNIATIYPDGEHEEIVSIWAGAGIGADPTKRIAELISENSKLKAEISRYLSLKQVESLVQVIENESDKK